MIEPIFEFEQLGVKLQDSDFYRQGFCCGGRGGGKKRSGSFSSTTGGDFFVVPSVTSRLCSEFLSFGTPWICAVCSTFRTPGPQ